MAQRDGSITFSPSEGTFHLANLVLVPDLVPDLVQAQSPAKHEKYVLAQVGI
jgi:hypothetical protein